VTDFPGFFEALWKSNKWQKPEPFPWQRLLAQGAEHGDWPQVISLPTASGKTACLDAAVYGLAATAHLGSDKRMPRRIWLVVDRRIVVDEAFTRARTIAERLANADGGALREVAEILRDFGGCKRPLRVARLRGGTLRDDSWAWLPSQPSIICSTVDQVGSALLFRAYGHSDETASIFAGLSAHDSLIILDEAHCAVPFMQTLSAVARFRSAPWAEQPLDTPFRYCIMSATPPSVVAPEAVFPGESQRAAALDHPLLEQRITARKLATLVKERDGELVSEAARWADKYLGQGRCRIAVMVNRVATAEEIAATLRKSVRSVEVILLTGRMRPLDRDALLSRWEDQLKAGSCAVLEKPLIVVTTQCLEVGADFSFDALVTECASLDALRQRFGRLDRLGELRSSEAAVLIRTQDTKEPRDPGDPVYGKALYETWSWLNEAGQRQVDGTVDFGIAAVDARIQALRVDDERRLTALSAPAPDAPVMLPAHLDLLCQTSPHPVPEPDVSLFLHGKGRQAREVRVVFRADLPEEDQDAWVETLSIVPPSSPEMLTVPLHRLRHWLLEESGDGSDSDVEGAWDDDEGTRDRMARKRFLIWRGRNRSEVTENIGRIRPNDIVVLHLTADALKGLGQTPDQSGGLGACRLDLAERAASQARGRALLRVRRDILEPFCGHASVAHLVEIAFAEPDQGEIEAGLNAVLAENAGPDEPSFLPEWLSQIIAHLCEAGGSLRMEPHPTGGLVVSRKWPRAESHEIEDDAFADEEDLRSAADEPVTLPQHTQNVRLIADDFVRRCLPDSSAEAVTAAALAHDLGKLDWRFQLLLHNGSEVDACSGAPLAKSADLPERRGKRREVSSDARLPAGFRHEFFSMQLAERFGLAPAALEVRDLALHLIASHHGYARPFAPVVPDELAATGQVPAVCLSAMGIDAKLDGAERQAFPPAHQLDSGVPSRFWRLTRRYGWWGLSYLESILRLADWEASRGPRIAPGSKLVLEPSPLPARSEAGAMIGLSALDGANPLAFLAALGTLRILTRSLPDHDLRLKWEQRSGAWRPILSSDKPLDEAMIADAVCERGFEVSRAFSDKLLAASEAAGPRNKKGEPAWRDKLLFPVAEFREFCRAASESPSERAEFAAAWAGETALSGEGDREVARRTRFDFTAGQQAFVAMLRELREACTATELRRSLFLGWLYSASTVSMRWDTQDEKRQYALQAVDPTNGSKNPPTADAGANFLAVAALPLFPLVPNRKAEQPGFDRDGRRWTWPIWTRPLGLDTIRSLLTVPYGAAEWPAWWRGAVGVSAIYQSRIVQPSGRYRCFTPARSL
jgi:CRISPR-associated endonuclease/helicase Cas3